MHKLLIATTNPGKLGEIKRYLSDLPLNFICLQDVSLRDKPEENGKNFEENAIIKAKFYAQRLDLPTIADDGGLEIDALGGQPGAKSHRWIHGDRENTDEELISYTLEQMRGLASDQRSAQLRVVIALVLPSGEVYTATAATRGIIAHEASRHKTAGFPYRSLLFLPEINKYYIDDELTQEENERYNHRRLALAKLKSIITKKIC